MRATAIVYAEKTVSAAFLFINLSVKTWHSFKIMKSTIYDDIDRQLDML